MNRTVVITALLTSIITGLLAFYFLTNKTETPPHVVTDSFRAQFNTNGNRLLSVPGTKNFRDLGGYKTVDGRQVKWGMIYRSDNLAHLDEAGIEAFKTLNIRAITDLRSDPERQQEPNIIPASSPGPIYNVLPINDRPVDIRALGKRIVTGKITDAEISDLLDHRRFITNPSHREHWGNWLADLAKDETVPHLFHCTSGKDRTGFGASIFLLAMGVDRSVVQEDFLLSNAILEDYNTARIAEIDRRVPGKIDETLFRKILGVSQDTIEASFAEMEAQYGSIDGFIRDGLGIDDATRQALRNKFLEAGQ